MVVWRNDDFLLSKWYCNHESTVLHWKKNCKKSPKGLVPAESDSEGKNPRVEWMRPRGKNSAHEGLISEGTTEQRGGDLPEF